MDLRRRPSWLVLGLTAAFCAAVTGFCVWILTPPTVVAERVSSPVTVTVTVPVTVTTSVPLPPPPPSSRPTPKPTGPQWVVRTPAGFTCVFDDAAVTCTGPFSDGTNAFHWTTREPDPKPTDAGVSLPGEATGLEYGTARSAGGWVIEMRRSGIEFHRDGKTWKVNNTGAVAQ